MRDVDRRLLNAACGGDAITLQRCIEEGADVGVEDDDKYFEGRTPLFWAAEGGSQECCRILLDKGANVNAVDKYDRTPLSWAAEGGSQECCRILLDKGATLDTINRAGETPLHLACYMYNKYSESKYFDVIRLLLHENADITIQNGDGQKPLDFLTGAKRVIVQQEYENFQLVRKLMTQGSRPVDVIKLILCGDPATGKTTIKDTLTKKLPLLSKIRNLLGLKKKQEEPPQDDTEEYERTAGIDVSKRVINGAGDFILWDCAGQVEYFITHGMLLDPAQSVFVVIYDLQKLEKGEISSTEYWLPFIKATGGRQQDCPQVLLVATHLDKIRNQQEGRRSCEEIYYKAKEDFKNDLDIDSALIILDARESDSEGMELLKCVLKKRKDMITGTKLVPKLCDNVHKLVRTEDIAPVISWTQYSQKVKDKYPGMDEDTLRSVTEYLHLLGDLFWAKLQDQDDQIILDIQWFTSEIIGRAFAGKAFAGQFQTLLDQPFFTKEELKRVFPINMDISLVLTLLDHMDLVHATEDGKYILPGKLPEDATEVELALEGEYEVKGRSIACKKSVDIFNPNVFPSVQKKIFDKKKGACIATRWAVKFAEDNIQVLVKLTKRKRAINVVVKFLPTKESTEKSYRTLEEIIEIIRLELHQKSRGTVVEERFLSQRAIRENRNLENVWSYTRKELEEAEPCGYVYHKADSEELTSILFRQQFVRDTVMDEDFMDVIHQLTPDQLQHLYTTLGMRRADIEKAEKAANTNDPVLKALSVLRKWRELNRAAASRKALLEGLEDCRFIDAMQTLEDEWGKLEKSMVDENPTDSSSATASVSGAT